MILFIVSFLAGVLTILAPCTLPLLPVMIGSSVSGTSSGSGIEDEKQRRRASRFKALRIASSLSVSVILFTLLLKFSTALISIPAFAWTLISGSIIIIFGLTTLFPKLWDSIPGVASLNVRSNKMLGVGYKRKGVLGDIIIGASLGPVFSTCSPTYFVILATVLPQSFLLGLSYLIAYAVGLGGMIMLVSVVGQRLVDKLGGLSDANGIFKKVLGVIFIALGVLILTGVDKIAEQKLLDSGVFDVTKVERSLLEFNAKNSAKSGSGANGIVGDITKSAQGADANQPQICTGTDGRCLPGANGQGAVQGNSTSAAGASTAAHRPSGLPIAPDFVKPSGFINTDGKEIHIGDYRGKKVILLDVWTYSCINCQRTLPYVNAWYEKYKDQGLEVIGLHTPEFAFEKVQSNVEREVQKLGIKYPVVMDNDYGTWNAYGNSYWPRKYLINEYGEIIYDHIGEGGYDETEMEIQKALAAANLSDANSSKKLTSDSIGATNISDPKNKIVVDPSKVQSPEVYFGFNRNTYLANGKASAQGSQTLTAPVGDALKNIGSNLLYLNGTWNFASEFASAKAVDGSGATDAAAVPKIIFKYNAKNVYMVLSGKVGANGAASPAQVDVYVDGVMTKTISVQDQQLYTIVEGKDYGVHTVELRLKSGELNAYTFTFG
jgi:cytochrome c biogenesis protein CcdA/thiol-disulfide isomerase/thioredoxin